MRFIVLSIVKASCLFLLFLTEAHAQSAQLGEYYQKKIEYQNKGDYKMALHYGEKMIQQAEKEFGRTHSTFANYASDLASLYQLMKDYSNAEKWYLVTLEIYGKHLGETHLYYGTTVYNLALVYHSQKKYEKAEPCFVKTLEIYGNNLGKTHDYYQMALNSMITFYDETDAYGKAENYLEDLLYFIEKKSGKNSKEYAIALSNLGLSAFKNGNEKKAEPSFLQSQKLLENLGEAQSEDYAAVSYNLYTLNEKTTHYEKASGYLKTYVDYVKRSKGEESLDYGMAQSYLGELYRNISLYQEAEQSFLKSIKIIEVKEGKGGLNYAILLNNLGYLYKLMAQYDKSETWLTEALAAHEKVVGKTDPQYAVVLNNLALLKTAQGKYEKAEEYYLQSASIEKNNLKTSETEYGSTLNNLGLLYTYMGLYSKSYDRLQEALKIKEKTIGTKHHEYANTLINIANLQTERGNYMEAEHLYLQSLEIYRSAVGTEDQKFANNLTNLGMLYFEMGQYERAIKFHTEALDIKGRVLGKEHPEYAASLNFIGMCYMSSDQQDLAVNFISQSLELRRKVLGKDHPDLTQPINNLALIAIQKGDFNKAISMLEQCVAIGGKAYGTESPTYATFLSNLASAYESQKNYEKAKLLNLQCLDIREKKLGKEHIRYAEVLSDLAYEFAATNLPEKAENFYLEANKVYSINIRNNFPYLSEKDKEAFYDQFKVQTNNFYAFALNRYDQNPLILKEVYNNQLNYKALLLNQTKDMRKYIVSSKDEKLIQLYQQWISQREYLAKLYSLDKTELIVRNIDLEMEEEKAEALEKELASRSSIFETIKQRKTIDWKDIQAKLKPNEAAIEIIRFYSIEANGVEKAGYFALVNDVSAKEYPSLVLLDYGGDLETKSYKLYSNSIRVKVEDNSSYTKYWLKIQEKISGLGNINKVYVSCDGVYNKISLPSLLNPVTKKYLMDELDLHLVSNTKSILQYTGVPSISSSVKRAELYGFPDYNNSEENVLSADQFVAVNRSVPDSLSRFLNASGIADLPGTEKEVMEIGNILLRKNMKVNTHLRHEASEKILKRIDNPYILHIATHGFFMKDETVIQQVASSEVSGKKTHPLMRSGLLLAGVKKSLNKQNQEKNIQNEDGVFTAYEAMNLNLSNTELVVLSACETGLGEIKNGEGIYGLQRAFEIAGAKSVLMSLWTVDDAATQELMTVFYQRWIETNNKHDAFSYAQKSVKEKYKSPYYWAAFVMVGE